MKERISLTEQLATFVVNTNYNDLPPEVLVSTKRRIVDTVGVAWAGSNAPGCDAALAATLADAPTGVSTVWGAGHRTSCRGAAFVNGMHAAALDFDSVYERGSVHPDIVIIPAAWAIAEQTGADGSAFLAAVALGNEVACRFGAANKRSVGWFYTSVHGTFGAAVAAAKLLDLDVDGITNAMGLALSRAAGSQQALVEKSLAKRAQSGFTAEAGVHSAQLAAVGLTGPREAIEGKFGFHTLYGEGDGEVLINGLGKDYESLSIAIKKYPSCTANHVPIDLLITAANAEDLSPDEIERIEVELSPFAEGLVGAPFEPSDNPQVAAQFSIHYSAASAVLRRRLGIAEIQDDAVFDHAIANLVAKIDVTVDKNNEGKFAPACVRVHRTGGEVMESRLDFVPGTIENPLSDREITDKFRDCAGFGLCPLEMPQVDTLLEILGRLEEQADLSGVFGQVKGGAY